MIVEKSRSFINQIDYQKLEFVIALFLFIISSIWLNWINKILFDLFDFPKITLSSLHLLATYLGLFIMSQLGLFKVVHIPIEKMLPMSIVFAAYVYLGVLSVETNTIGTYLCFRGLNTVGVMLVSSFLFGVRFSAKVVLCTVPVLLGVLVNAMHNLEFNHIGFMIASVWLVISSFYFVTIEQKIIEFKITPMQLLVYQAPLAAILLAILVPLSEPVFDYNGIFDLWNRPKLETVCLLVSSVSALIANTTTYWLISLSSPLVFTMVRQLKFIPIVFSLVVVFQEPFRAEQIIATFLIISGLVAYSLVSKRESDHT